MRIIQFQRLKLTRNILHLSDKKTVQMYMFTNGLTLCPRKFTKLLKPAYCYLRQKGHLSSGYTDDSYLQGEEHQDCLANVVDTIKLFDSVGFIIHPEVRLYPYSNN